MASHQLKAATPHPCAKDDAFRLLPRGRQFSGFQARALHGRASPGWSGTVFGQIMLASDEPGSSAYRSSALGNYPAPTDQTAGLPVGPEPIQKHTCGWDKNSGEVSG